MGVELKMSEVFYLHSSFLMQINANALCWCTEALL